MTGAAALAALSVVAALGFARIFSPAPAGAVLPALGAVVAHVLVRAGAVRRWRPLASVLAPLGGLTVLTAWGFEVGTTAYGIPTPATFAALARDLDAGLADLRSAAVPVSSASPLLLLATVLSWLSAVSADTVAFRMGALLPALIPPFTVFTLTASLGTDRFEAPLTAAFVVATLLVLLVHAPAEASSPHGWLVPLGSGRSRAAVVRAGLPVVALAAVAAPLLGPRLPEARSAGLLDVGTRSGGPRTRVTVSPLVDIRDRLTLNPPVEAFRVRAARPAYWRLAALESFDGVIWSSLATYRKASGHFPSDGNRAAGSALTQDFAITGLAQFWLPAAYRPVSIDLPGARVNAESLTLLTDRETADGLTYRVESVLPEYTPAELASARLPDAAAFSKYLALPPDFPSAVRDLARQITASAPTPYHRALALQEFFRTRFRYREDVPAGHSANRMVEFLFRDRAGYCEQFSASFAAMARSLGIPARVAVGFTPGRPDSSGTYVVTSAEAHAWPEVYLEPFGWVAFEPTPSRFHPAPSNWTGTYNPAAQQAGVATTPAPTPQTTPPARGAASPSSPTTATVPAGGARESRDPWPGRLALAATFVILAVVTPLVLHARRRHRRREHHHESDPRLSILQTWEEILAALRTQGFDVTPSQTPAEVVRAAGSERPELAPPLEAVRPLVEVAAYSPHDPDPDDAALASLMCARLLAHSANKRAHMITVS